MKAEYPGSSPELTNNTVTTCIVPGGIGFGGGNIEVNNRLNDPEDPLTPEVMQNVNEFLTSPEALVDISIDTETGINVDDDGCGDGREVSIVFKGDKKKKRSLVRPKVFGGAPVMTLAARIGNDETAGVPLQKLFSDSVATLEQRGIDFGGHSDTHATGDNCGCGAIDKAPEIIHAVVEHEEGIKRVIEILGLETDDLEGAEGIFANYYRYDDLSNMKGVPYSGKVALGELREKKKVIKELDGTHNEVAVVLNYVQGKTVNQQKIRDISDDSAQVFAVDVWRLQSIATRLYPDDESRQNKALLSMVVYTLGVAATLTRGDLPVYVTKQCS